MSFIKSVLLLTVLGMGGFLGWNYYADLSKAMPPTLEVTGLNHDSGISQDTQIILKGYDARKVASLQVLVDENPLIEPISLGKKSFSVPVTLLVKNFPQGKHTLMVQMTSTDPSQPKTRIEVPFHVDTMTLQAVLTKNGADARVYQGRTLHVEFQANKEIQEATLKTLSQSYSCYLQSQRGFIYECFVPIDCEEVAQEYPFAIDIRDWAGNTMQLEGTFAVIPFPFKKQVLRVDTQKIQEENALGRPEQELEDTIVTLSKNSPRKKLWHGRFIAPLDLKDPKQVTSDFGVIRATQERGLSQHKALDLVAAPKSVVWAPQDGILVLKERFAHSGNTVALDHGYGLISLFFHLDEFADSMQVGQMLKKGKPIGTVGKTGYATGYHLHWEMRVNTVPVEPLEWTQPNF
jgi:murein DD-endopeptidase MepM/ murein hydrolase activator NlpD